LKAIQISEVVPFKRAIKYAINNKSLELFKHEMKTLDRQGTLISTKSKLIRRTSKQKEP
jgi:hypothetical protein